MRIELHRRQLLVGGAAVASIAAMPSTALLAQPDPLLEHVMGQIERALADRFREKPDLSAGWLALNLRVNRAVLSAGIPFYDLNDHLGPETARKFGGIEDSFDYVRQRKTCCRFTCPALFGVPEPPESFWTEVVPELAFEHQNDARLLNASAQPGWRLAWHLPAILDRVVIDPYTFDPTVPVATAYGFRKVA